MVKKKRRVSQATKNRLKALRRKFGLGEFKRNAKRRKKSARIAPVVKRRGSVMARRRRGSSRVRSRSRRRGGFNMGGLNIERLAFQGFGAGMAGVAASYANQFSGGRLAGNTAQGVAGVALWFVGKKVGMSRYTNPVAEGILIKTVGDFVEDNVAPKLLGMTVGSGSITNGDRW